MQTSPQGLALIEQSEGFRSTVYKDLAGIATIGYGHRIEPGESFPHPLTLLEAEVLLSRDVAAAELAIERLVHVPLTQGQFDALVDFVFNLGSGRLASSTLLVDLNARLYDKAAAQLLLWDHAAGKENEALKRRRQAEHSLFTAEQTTAKSAA